MTDDQVSLKITKGSRPTILTIKRHRHRPFEIEVIVDHTLTKNQDLVTRQKRKSTTDRSAFSSYRLLWIGMIFIGIILTMFNVFISVFLEILNTVTPGWSSTQQALGVIGFVVLVFGFWIMIIPILNRQKSQSMKLYDKSVLEKVCTILDELRSDKQDNAVVRCWSCFKEIERSEKFCPHCGEQQN
jgi:hypothetical protein